MGKLNDLIGRRFGKLVVVGRAEDRDAKHTFWICLCDCGSHAIPRSDALLSGMTRSCGCRQGQRTHELSKVPEHHAWNGMIQRCHSVTNKDYHKYGGRGISVCTRWRNSFLNFYNDMGKKPGPEYSVGRRDNNGNYSPDNCSWETPRQQSNNTRRNKKYRYGGKDMTVRELCKFSVVDFNTLRTRLYRGIPIELALYKIKKGVPA